MSVTSGFYNALHKSSTGYDRLYKSGEMSQLFDGLIIDGIYLSSKKDDETNQQFMVSAGEGMSIKVAPGRAWFNGTYTFSTTELILSIDSASFSYDRIDALVIEVNTSNEAGVITDEGRKNDIGIVKGTPAQTPEKPTLIHSDTINQYPIAYITVNKGATEIRPYNIEYVVGIDTPYFAWLGETFNIVEINSKWKPILGTITESFVAWFSAMQRMLGNGDSDYTNIKSEVSTIRNNAYIRGTLPRVNESVEAFIGDGITENFVLTGDVNVFADILIDDTIVFNYEYNSDTKTVTFETPPADNSQVEVYYVPNISNTETYTLYFEEV